MWNYPTKWNLYKPLWTLLKQPCPKKQGIVRRPLRRVEQLESKSSCQERKQVIQLRYDSNEPNNKMLPRKRLALFMAYH